MVFGAAWANLFISNLVTADLVGFSHTTALIQNVVKSKKPSVNRNALLMTEVKLLRHDML